MAVAAGDRHTLLLRSDGRVMAFGDDGDSDPTFQHKLMTRSSSVCHFHGTHRVLAYIEIVAIILSESMIILNVFGEAYSDIYTRVPFGWWLNITVTEEEKRMKVTYYLGIPQAF